jgi:hypothetical protein
LCHTKALSRPLGELSYLFCCVSGSHILFPYGNIIRVGAKNQGICYRSGTFRQNLFYTMPYIPEREHRATGLERPFSGPGGSSAVHQNLTILKRSDEAFIIRHKIRHKPQAWQSGMPFL